MSEITRHVEVRPVGAPGVAADAVLPAVKPCDQPCLLVIFGASGDLMQLKLAPALFALHRARLLPEQFGIVGVSRKQGYHEPLLRHVKEGLSANGHGPDAEAWQSFRGI